MDPAILSATSALAGSLIGGASSLAASWITPREQMQARMLLRQAVKRKALYTDFIVETSRRFVEAWGFRPRVLKLSRPLCRGRTDAVDVAG
jgi:hypothetical protein